MAVTSGVTLTEKVLEASNAKYSSTLVDEAGVGVDVGQLSALTLTYYDEDTETILNSRNAQNILNQNNVTVTTVVGPPLVTTMVWDIQPGDAVLHDVRKELEWHVALFRWTWGGGKIGSHEIRFQIENLLKV